MAKSYLIHNSEVGVDRSVSGAFCKIDKILAAQNICCEEHRKENIEHAGGVVLELTPAEAHFIHMMSGGALARRSDVPEDAVDHPQNIALRLLDALSACGVRQVVGPSAFDSESSRAVDAGGQRDMATFLLFERDFAVNTKLDPSAEHETVELINQRTQEQIAAAVNGKPIGMVETIEVDEEGNARRVTDELIKSGSATEGRASDDDQLGINDLLNAAERGRLVTRFVEKWLCPESVFDDLSKVITAAREFADNLSRLNQAPLKGLTKTSAEVH